MSYAVMPGDKILIHLWRCWGEGCYNAWHFEISGTGEFHDVTRESMSVHVQETGHEVEYVHGVVETLTPLRTEVNQP